MLRGQVFRVLLIILLLTIVTLQAFSMVPRRVMIHTVVLTWSPVQIGPRENVSGYVANYSWRRDVLITAVQIWMGNPLGIIWEGNVRVVLNDVGDFHSTDQVIAHYQFDKHAESPVPHQAWFQIGSDNSGFPVRASETLWIWRVFVNVSDSATTSADGHVIIYYIQD